MLRRWHLVVFVLLAALALACEGAGTAAPEPTGPAKKGLPASMGALGDSITAGYGTCFTLRGVQPQLVVDRQQRRSGQSLPADPGRQREDQGQRGELRRAGRPREDLARQAVQAVDDKAQYVTVLIGANDACTDRVADMTGTGTFRKHVDAALARLKKGLPKARVLVVSIPDLYRLWQLGHDDKRAVRAWSGGVCQSLLARPTSTAQADEERRREVADRVDAYNRELEAACEKYGTRCRWDGGDAHRVRFSLDLVNEIDYFHPDVEGQNKLADVTYPGRFTW